MDGDVGQRNHLLEASAMEAKEMARKCVTEGVPEEDITNRELIIA